mgnify:CR=1 FL=1
MGQSTSFKPACIARSLIAFDFFVVTYALDLFICTERKIYSVRILYHLLSELMPDKVRQISADSQLSESLPSENAPAPEKPVVILQSGLQFYAFTRLGFWDNASFSTGKPFFNDHYFFFEPFFQHLKSGKNTRGACADDQYIRFQITHSFT